MHEMIPPERGDKCGETSLHTKLARTHSSHPICWNMWHQIEEQACHPRLEWGTAMLLFSGLMSTHILMSPDFLGTTTIPANQSGRWHSFSPFILDFRVQRNNYDVAGHIKCIHSCVFLCDTPLQVLPNPETLLEVASSQPGPWIQLC